MGEGEPLKAGYEYGVHVIDPATGNALDPRETAPGRHVIVDVALTLDTAAYVAADLMADTQAIANAARANDLGVVLESVTVIDVDNVTAANNAIDIYFLDANVSFGTENNAPTITGADLLKIQGKVSFVTADFVVMATKEFATKGNLGIGLKPAAGSRTIYFAVVVGTGAGPTHTAGGVTLRFAFRQD